MKRLILPLLLSFALCLAAPPALADIDQLDTTFGVGGSFTEQNPSGTDSSSGFIVKQALGQPDGKALVLQLHGTGCCFFGKPYRVSTRVARHLVDGSLDPAFGGGAPLAVFSSTQRGDEFGYDGRMALQDDGKIVVAARSDTPCPSVFCPTNVGVTRLNPDGSVDPSFGNSGTVLLAGYVKAFGLAVQADGKIVLGIRGAVVRLLANGTADPSYGNGGVGTPALVDNGNPFYYFAFALQSDGSAVVARQEGTSMLSIAKMTPAGAPDTAFNGTGGRLYANSNSGVQVPALTVQADGRIVVGGSQSKGSVLLRILPDGNPDSSFGTNGSRSYQDGAALSALSVDSRGRLVGAGAIGGKVALRRWLSNGDDDPSLNGYGRATTNLAGGAGSLQLLARAQALVHFGGNSVARFGIVLPMVPIHPASLDFGSQSMGVASAPRTVYVTNLGSTPLTVNGITVSNPFSQVNDCTTVAPKGACSIDVTFAPEATPGPLNAKFPVTATLTVASSRAESPESVPLAGVGEKSLVALYYRAILRRDPDSQGKAFWEGEAQRVANLGADVNETWFALAQTFFFSAEYAVFQRDNVGFVTDLYKTFFNRLPESGGLDYWTGLIADGMPREVVLTSFMFSPEFVAFAQAIFGNTWVRAEMSAVTDFYRGMLGRLPDDGGFSYWRGRFRTAQCSGAAAVGSEAEAISSAFAFSAEYAGRARNNSGYVADLYNAFLRRGGDLGGVKYWIDQITTGARTREDVRQAFVGSPEFQNRIGQVIAEGCPGPP